MVYLGGIALFFMTLAVHGMDGEKKSILSRTIDEKHVNEADVYFKEIAKGSKNNKQIKTRLEATIQLYRTSISQDEQDALKIFREMNSISRESWKSVHDKVKKIHELNSKTHNKKYDSELIVSESFPDTLKRALIIEMSKTCICYEETNLISNYEIKGCGTMRAYPYRLVKDNDNSNILLFTRGKIVVNPFFIAEFTPNQLQGLAIHLVASLTYKGLIFTDILMPSNSTDEKSLAALYNLFVRKIILLKAALNDHNTAACLKEYIPISDYFDVDTYEFLSNIEWRLRVLSKTNNRQSISEKDEDNVFRRANTIED